MPTKEVGEVMPAEIKLAKPAELVSPTPLSILEMAVRNESSIDTIERLVKLQGQMLEREAKNAYLGAMQRAQQKMEPVRRNAKNNQTHSRYATYEALNSAIRPHYTAEGLSISYNTAESHLPEHIKILANVSHVAGHTESFQIDMPVDGKGAKGGDVMTKTHAMVSGVSYGRRTLLKAIFDIAEYDDDGNAAGGKAIPTTPGLADEVVTERLEWIENCRDLVELQRIHLAACKLAQEAEDKGAELSFIKAANARKLAIREGR